jgi:hypothetical protein
LEAESSPLSGIVLFFILLSASVNIKWSRRRKYNILTFRMYSLLQFFPFWQSFFQFYFLAFHSSFYWRKFNHGKLQLICKIFLHRSICLDYAVRITKRSRRGKKKYVFPFLDSVGLSSFSILYYKLWAKKIEKLK